MNELVGYAVVNDGHTDGTVLATRRIFATFGEAASYIQQSYAPHLLRVVDLTDNNEEQQ